MVSSSEGFSILVVELSDDFGPRRRPDRPNLHVEVVQGDPHRRFDEMRKSKRRHARVREFGVCVRDDLIPNLASYTTSSKERIEEAKKRLVRKLKHKAYTVNGDLTVWHLYVIELKDTVGEWTNPKYPWVYVGETSIAIDDRYRQHVEGARNKRGRLYSPVVRNYHLRLRPDLYKHEPPYFTASDAKKAEAELAERLRAQGYSVKGGHQLAAHDRGSVTRPKRMHRSHRATRRALRCVASHCRLS